MNDTYIFTDAKFSMDRIYRYVLWRKWEVTESYVMFIGLNPSKADETKDDPTIRRCVNFAKSWGYGSLCMLNLFAFRATKPGIMMSHYSPVGVDNNIWLKRLASKAEIVVTANIQEWQHIFKMRTAKTAHPQIRALMIPVLEELKKTVPILFDDIELEK